MRRLVPLLRAASLCVPVLLGNCAPVDALNATIDTSGLVIQRDVSYAPGPRHAMDVYRPADISGPLPVVVFFYGGSWQTGSKRDYLFAAAELARRGMIVAVPDYRLYPQVRFPGFLQDAAQAVAYVQAHAAGWGGDSRRLVLVGHSAGAWLAVMLALDLAWLRAAGMDRGDIAGVAGLAGPYDFLPITGPDIQAVFSSAADLAETQPVNFVDGRNPPMLLLHGDADDTVLARNSHALAARIRAAGGPVVEKTYPGVGHIGIISSFAPLLRGRSPSQDDVAAFISGLPGAGL